MPASSRRQFLKAAGGLAGVAGLTTSSQASPPSSFALQGVDVSRWQGAITWASVRANGIRFAFCKATEGTSHTDPWFATNWAGLRTAGIIRGAYHFGRPAQDPVVQANRLCAVVGAGDLRPVLDIEATDSLTPTQVRDWIAAFVGQVVTRLGLPPIIYTGYFFWRDQAGNGPSLGCPLWLANWTNDSDNLIIPAAWTNWTFWQFSSTGSVPGVTGNVDRNVFRTTKTALNNLRLQ